MPKINELSEKQDRELVELLIGGSQAALGELYARFKERLMYLCKQYMRNEADAEDIVHDVFLKIWNTRNFLNPEMSFSGYVQTITQNHTMKKFRHFDVHSRFVQSTLINETDSTNQTEDQIIDNDYEKLLEELIEGLSPRQKEVYRLSRKEGHTYKEIAELLHISVETVKEHASLALKKIEKQLMQHTDIHFKTVITILMFFL
jgi:RNA polymerase sigma-70 factor (ECF subfamily)